MFFERELYPQLISWAQKSRHALYLEGPRQVGKTELLKKLGKEHFDICVYIDVRIDGDKFESLMDYHMEKFGRSTFPEEMGEVWEGVLREFAPEYINSNRTLVILDEIQESPKIHNEIRYLRRGLKSKLAVSGSYLGITTQSKEYWHAAGDLVHAELASLSFREFLKANGAWDKYDKIITFDLARMTDAEQEICEQVRELYRIYCQIGGYPDVVQEWVISRDVESCKQVVVEILRLLYKESSNYFGEVIGTTLWASTLGRVTEDIVSKSGDLDTKIAKEFFRSEDSQGLSIRRKDKVNALKWLMDCGIIGMVLVYSEMNSTCTLGNKFQFYLRDMGILTRLVVLSTNIPDSNVAGMMAENFTFMQLRNMLEKEFIGANVHTFNGAWGQIDFIMHNRDRRRFGIEVKHGSGNTKSGDKALADGKIDFLIRVQDTYGSIDEKQATIPIFMLDKLKYIVVPNE